jgi:hypothetical protein
MINLSLSKLTVKEFSEFTNTVIKIGEKHQPYAAEMQVFLDSLKGSTPDIELLTKQNKSNAITELIKQDRNRIKELHNAIITQIRAVEKGKIPSLDDALYLIGPLAKNYLSFAYASNSHDININTNNFLLELKSSEAHVNAAKTLGIELFTTELEAVKTRYDLNCSARRSNYAHRRAIRDRELRKVLQTKLQNFIKAKELAEITDSSFDFKPLNTDLEELYSSYRANILNRETRNLNNALKKESVTPTLTSDVTDTSNDELN